VQQRLALVPGHCRRALEHVVALQCRDRDAGDLGDAQRRRQRAVALADVIEHLFVVIHQVHLVHRQQHVADPEQRNDVTVAPGLRQQALARIHQHHREVGRGGAGGHVAGVLLVPGAVGDDELALVGTEETVGDVDGDALLALRGKAIHQQREIDLAVLGAMALAVRLQRRQLVVQQQAGVVQQAPDQRALAVVDAAAGDEAQQVLGLVLLQVGGDLRAGCVGVGQVVHQK